MEFHMYVSSISVNRKFKSSVFTTLFDNPDLLRELYCALEGATLPPDFAGLYPLA